ncbi:MULTISPECIES: NHL domain-containing thioredoxin family protein [unclassified Solwaraspora]|uniref:NHL domain-containing thioredoxin family protein n=1 Tax=unclassified Solwaraspora TaxID=2627926 RepID=UPI00248AEC21|nr:MULTISPECIES: NHL domain-containing thioredoxin family protein [unclassified Solwaraspora]WBB96952.1 redoxin domain-containing protein [Solwaraspora sp. WMMA2059]WBC19144.1 redoxin domain-containing protein [Solwaraspora sp. WMMA2080]WJK33441.1 NHL domain-containing thioredoxin family protein [Solwaraspora sp. WMMA2065]
MTAPRVRAPELNGRQWLNTDGRDIGLRELRGRIVLLDFWTFCCVNCLHVLDELRPLEERYADVLVVIGIHSPKFAHERDPAAVAAAVERYGVSHPVLDDPELDMWQQYAARAWPTLVLVDPEGYVVATMAGEGHADGLSREIDQLIRTHEAKGTLRRGDGPYLPPTPADTTLRFPGKAVALDDGALLVSDSARHQLVELEPDGETVRRRIGTGERGGADGSARSATFSEPQGLLRLPADVAAVAGYDIVVADTVNHLLRGLRYATGEVRTVAGSGRQWRSTVDYHPHDARAVDLSSPWDLAWYDGKVIVAMAGIHQLWWFDPATRTTGMYAGTTVESLRDGPIPDVWLAQPSGLATSVDGHQLWIADSETSALRRLADGELRTVVGQGLFDFGQVDGAAADALLQHPLGVCALADGSVLVADTYNGAVRRYDPATDRVSTVTDGLAEPSDVLVTTDGTVWVVESAAHRLTRLAPGALSAAGATVVGARRRAERPPTLIAPGELSLEVVFTPAPGQKLDASFGPATRLEVSADPPELLLDGAGSDTGLTRRLVIDPAVAAGVLQVVAQAATCDADAEHAACHLTRQDWGVPVRIDPAGAGRLPLILRGVDSH